MNYDPNDCPREYRFDPRRRAFRFLPWLLMAIAILAILKDVRL